MKSVLQLTIVVACLLAACVAHAAPTFYYDANTGGIYLQNDTGAPIAAISVISAGGNFTTDTSRYAAVSGAQFDLGDLPFAFTYLHFPPAQPFPGIFIGNVAKPGLSGWREFSGIYHQPLTNAGQPFYHFIFPEPASGTLTVIASTAFIGLARRFRR